ncbi:Transmembrane protein 26 [Triplophysa tibetana]|uniref:Transmembrane protein 26 n=1 Tax=Triplophysa tibetana TaxID=1572043 RepID=A0A5A9NP07_9TELE|nr:Transmembrane protein 26 [Triplophysa tibetana]KAA0711046.1 Transmembrane protein 26 [Triplophysa tibetana]
MNLFKFVCAIITRFLFILVSLVGVWRVTKVKNDNLYWLLTIVYLPLVAEMIIAFKRRNGQDYKRLTPSILFFLISIIPSIWILELHHQGNRDEDLQCKKLDSWETVKSMVSPSSGTLHTETLKHLERVLTSVCPNAWILGLHQALLILLILGKWLLPLGVGVTRDELSQLLLVFVGTAADILEFTNESMSDVKWGEQPTAGVYNSRSVDVEYVAVSFSSGSLCLCYSIVATSRLQNSDESGDGCCNFLMSRHCTDIWNIVESLFIQDGPFLVVRLIVMINFGVFHQMLVFFAIKNFLVVILNLYRLIVICLDLKPPSSSSSPSI